MKFYLARTMYQPQVDRANSNGWGEMCVRQLPHRARGAVPAILDNGAYKDFIAGRPLNQGEFWRVVDGWVRLDVLPVAVIAFDIVAGGMASLELSYTSLPKLREWGPPVLLPVQDGMTRQVIASALKDFDGLFVGGSTWWKFMWGGFCVKLAHRNMKPCHVGRLGTEPRLVWGRLVGADSCDSTTPLRPGEEEERYDGAPLSGMPRRAVATSPGIGRNWLAAERAMAATLSYARHDVRRLTRRLAGASPSAQLSLLEVQ